MLTLTLEYQPEMRPLYELLSDLPGFVLLESADVTIGRYDIVSAYPYDRIRIEANDDITKALDDLNERLSIKPSTCDLPFQGGAIGYVAYDLGARLAGIVSKAQPGLEDQPLLDLGFYDWAVITDHHLKKVTLFAANNQPETMGIIDEVLTIWQCAEQKSGHFELDGQFKPLISKASYEESFTAIKVDISKGRSYQVNYTQPFIVDYQGSSWAIYEQICSENPVPFAAYLSMEECRILSFSPERYLLLDNQQLLSSPIKGTMKRSQDSQEDLELKNQLQQCPKNRAENVMIVDLLRNDLGKIASTGSVEVSALCEVQSFNGVHHLVSDIRAQCLPSISPIQAFLSCFPGGSITGAPKLESMHVIHEQEPYSRGVYCGAITYFSAHGRFDSNIAIRTMTDINNQLYLAAGGGLVFDSNCADEYSECFTKLSAIVQALNNHFL